ncbi:hypothetical protein [Paenimyroides baculatum]|uniref:Uncharacterized protein n=1 Tax=Paenimyroides baculatum TaxID=2608000 RepID=A0A5M6CJ51_9FLAO|nr:hypothetical protein [Paenimyroides baculatum]KAA5533972.1 hypothetical protein F0460_11605 [Paenimyroides baculatum]
MKILSKIRSLKFAIYKFLGKFIPYFKNKLLFMTLIRLKEDIKERLNDILKEKFKGYILATDVLFDCSNDDEVKTSMAKYNIDNTIKESKLNYSILFNCNNANVFDIIIYYCENDIKLKYKIKQEVTSEELDNFKEVEKCLLENKDFLISKFEVFRKVY